MRIPFRWSVLLAIIGCTPASPPSELPREGCKNVSRTISPTEAVMNLPPMEEYFASLSPSWSGELLLGPSDRDNPNEPPLPVPEAHRLIPYELTITPDLTRIVYDELVSLERPGHRQFCMEKLKLEGSGSLKTENGSYKFRLFLTPRRDELEFSTVENWPRERHSTMPAGFLVDHGVPADWLANTYGPYELWLVGTLTFNSPPRDLGISMIWKEDVEGVDVGRRRFVASGSLGPRKSGGTK